ncbi:MAG: peptidase inhibitor family I36 protein [Devosia sp.]
MTKDLLIRVTLASVALLALGGGARAVEAVATTNVNVRTGPGTTFSIVDRMIPGERVDIRECTAANWCFVDREGADGWVSSTYLTAPPAAPPAPPPGAPPASGEDCSFGFTLGPGGPNLSINCGTGTPPAPPGPPSPPVPPPAPPSAGDEACFYTGTNYSGAERCFGEGTFNTLPPQINDRISSLRLYGDAQVELCVNPNLGGACRSFDVDTPNLPPQINDRASSASVFVPEPPAPAEPPEACFYTGSNFSGAERCYPVGVRNALPPAINDQISSVRLFGGASARLCANTNLNGVCRVVSSDSPTLPPQIDDRASSLEVAVGIMPLPVPPIFPLPPITPVPPPAPPAPVTYSTGPIDLQQTFTVNLDNGQSGGPGVDLWYQAVNAGEKYLTPRNGALLAVGDRSNRGFAGCSAASFSGDRVPLWSIPVGSYVCARTDQGRISQFRVNGFTGTTMNLGYTTWAN